jgi:hypothetical protein
MSIGIETLVTWVNIWLAPIIAGIILWKVKTYEKVERKIRKLLLKFELFGDPNFQIVGYGKLAIKPLKKYLQEIRSKSKTELDKLKYKHITNEIEGLLLMLGDMESRSSLISRLQEKLKSQHYQKIMEALDEAERFGLKELAPLIFKRLKNEKDDAIRYHLIRSLGTLNYLPALPYLVDQALNSAMSKLSYAYEIAIGNYLRVAPENIDKKTYSKICKLFIKWLESGDNWLIDAVLRVDLPYFLKYKSKIDKEVLVELSNSLIKFLANPQRQREFKEWVIENIIELRDKNAISSLQKLVEKEQDATIREKLEKAMKIISEEN